jgi:small subunit ribosomal protein S12
MPTINQLLTRKKKFRRNIRKVLKKCPQKKGYCLKIINLHPKKPNSANRRAAKVKLSNNLDIFCHIPGIGHNLQKFSNVLIRGCHVRDLPGIKYRIVRGKYDTTNVVGRMRARSKYGTKKFE